MGVRYRYKEFNWSYPTWGIMLLLEVIGCQIKSPVPGVGYFSFRGILKTLKQYKLLTLLLNALQNLMVRSCCWEHHILQSQDTEKSSTDQEASSRMASCHSTGRCCSSCQGRKIRSLTQLWNLWITVTEWQDMPMGAVVAWMLWGNQLFSDWI